MIRIWYTNKQAFINTMMGIYISNGVKPSINNLKETHEVVWENFETKVEAQPLQVRGHELDKCKALMTKFNSDYRNPLSAHSGKEGQAFQEKIKDNEINVIHTSMSIGDVIQIDNNYYLVDLGGFTKLEKNIIRPNWKVKDKNEQ